MDQVTLITGAGIGIGAATARAFATAGHHVVVTDVLPEAGETTAAHIREAGGSAEFAYLDVTDSAAVDELFARVLGNRGRIDVVIGNAGIAPGVPVEELTDERWDQTVDVNLNGIRRVFRAAVPAMRQQGSGALIGLSSIMGAHYGWPDHAHYSAAKGGVIGLVKGLAVELAGAGIRVNAIAPGYIRTAQSLDEVNSSGEAGLARAAGWIPLGRVGDPEDVADVALFLASHASRYITGQVITVDGGLVVGRF